MSGIAPWSRRTLGWTGAAHLVGAAGLCWSWIMASGRGTVAAQIESVNVAVISLVVVLSADGAYLLAGRRATGRRMAALAAAVRGSADLGLAAQEESSHEPVALGASSLYHRADCAFVKGREAFAADRDRHEAAGRASCGVCRP